MMADKIPEMVTIRTAAKKTGFSYDAIRRLCVEGRIVCVRIGSGRGKILVNMDKFVEFLNGKGAAE